MQTAMDSRKKDIDLADCLIFDSFPGCPPRSQVRLGNALRRAVALLTAGVSAGGVGRASACGLALHAKCNFARMAFPSAAWERGASTRRVRWIVAFLRAFGVLLCRIPGVSAV